MNQVTFFSRVKCVFALLLLMLIDIGPVPVTALIGLFIILFRPAWFKDLIDQIYSAETSIQSNHRGK